MRLRSWLLLTLSLQLPNPTPRTAIEGTVIRSDSGAPLSNVQVDLVKFSQASSANLSTTASSR